MTSVHLSFFNKVIARLRPEKYIAVEKCPSRGSRTCWHLEEKGSMTRGENESCSLW